WCNWLLVNRFSDQPSSGEDSWRRVSAHPHPETLAWPTFPHQPHHNVAQLRELLCRDAPLSDPRRWLGRGRDAALAVPKPGRLPFHQSPSAWRQSSHQAQRTGPFVSRNARISIHLQRPVSSCTLQRRHFSITESLPICHYSAAVRKHAYPVADQKRRALFRSIQASRCSHATRQGTKSSIVLCRILRRRRRSNYYSESQPDPG